MKNLTRLFKDESGVTAIEYGLIAALISVVCIGAMTTAGTQLTAVKQALAAILLGRSVAAPRVKRREEASPLATAKAATAC